MRCPTCGAQNPDWAGYCGQCGAKIPRGLPPSPAPEAAAVEAVGAGDLPVVGDHRSPLREEAAVPEAAGPGDLPVVGDHRSPLREAAAVPEAAGPGDLPAVGDHRSPLREAAEAAVVETGEGRGVRCPECGSTVTAGAAFCGHCGASTTHGPPREPAAPPLPAVVRCPMCGGEVRAGATFCGHCGAPLAGAGRPAGQMAAAAAPAVAAQGGRGAGPERGRRRWGCRRIGCLAAGVVALVVLGVAGWFAGLHTGTWEKLGVYRPPEARLLGGRPNEAAAQELKAELVAAGLSDAGLQVAVLPVKDKGYNLAVVVLDASQGFQGTGSADLLLECLQRLATGDAAGEYGIGRVAVHYRDAAGKKLLSLTAATRDVRAFASGQMSRAEFLKAVEGNVEWSTLLGGMP